MPELGSGQLRNYNCLALMEQIDRVLIEVSQSVSATTNDYREPDKVRLQSYINAITAYLDYSSKVPYLDRPHSHPLMLSYPEPPVPVQSDMDNLAGRALVHSLHVFRINIGMSQSSDMSNGYVAQDLSRFRSYVLDLQSLLSDFISKVQPLDLPETSVPNK